MSRALLIALFCVVSGGAVAQDTLQDMPRYDRYEKLRREIAGSVKRGSIIPTWADDSKSFNYAFDGKTYKFDVATKTKSEVTNPDKPAGSRRQGNAPERGRQFDTAITADGKWKAVSRDNNVFVSTADGKNEIAVTTDGSKEGRTKYGIASWVYGEELNVRQAMWWSPDGKKLAFYHFDEKPVKDYFIAMGQSQFQDTLDTEAYPKAGTNNPVVTLIVYDVDTKKTVAMDTKFADASLGEYVYDVNWSPDGTELLYNRTNRKQNVMEFCAANPATGASRAIAREEQKQSWAENHPVIKFLDDKKRFVWSTEKNGYKNFELRDTTGKILAELTQNKFDADDLVRVDERAGEIWYTARSVEDNPYLGQLHKAKLDGKGDQRLTDGEMSHTVFAAPDGSCFVDTAQTIDQAPITRLCDRTGNELATIEKSDLSKFNELNLKKAKRFTFKSFDGAATLFGTMTLPSDFDESKKYPVVVSVYGGPESGGGAEAFQTPNPITEFGFISVTIEGRGTNSRGKAFRDAVYGKLGIVEIDDQAAGVAALRSRPYVDAKLAGIYGTSYGGYASLMCLLRHPEVFTVACSSSSVTDWRHYDTIYTERYMGLPGADENLSGYDAGSAMTYAKDLKGKLMLYFGTADNNVHPANTLMLVQKLESAGKQYDMQVGPDRGHTGMNYNRMWEYFITNLIVRPPKDSLALAYKSRRSS